MEQSKLDAVLNGLIDKVDKRGNGFILNLAKDSDGQQNILVQEALKPVDDYIPPSACRCHAIGDTESFIAFAGKYGSPDKSLVLFNDVSCTLVLDESVSAGDRESARMAFTQSPEFMAWSGMIGRPVVHKQLLAFLLLNTHTIDSPAILDAMRSVRFNAVVDSQSDIMEDAKTIGVMVKTGAGEQLKQFPKEFVVNVPVLEQDAIETTNWRMVTIRLHMDLPERPQDTVAFTLLCSEWNLLVRQRVSEEMSQVRDALEDWTIVRGTPAYFPRAVGRGSCVVTDQFDD